MSVAPTPADEASDRFRMIAFCRLPIAVMTAAAVAGACAGPGWSEHAGPLPWIVSLAIIGLPHGAADCAVSRRVFAGRALVAVWAAYVAAMAAVVAAMGLAPRCVLLAFAGVSCWHFGTADVAITYRAGGRPRIVATLASGCAALAVPLAAWPSAAGKVAADVAGVAIGPRIASDLFPPRTVMAVGLVLCFTTVAATTFEWIRASRCAKDLRACHAQLVACIVIGGMGWFTHPLFSVGTYFLVWHAWREMDPLAESLAGSCCRTWRDIGRSLFTIHAAAVPLLVPTWVALGTVWWQRSSSGSLRDLAIVSIAVYLVVTPAHGVLGSLMRSKAARPGTVLPKESLVMKGPAEPPHQDEPPGMIAAGGVPSLARDCCAMFGLQARRSHAAGEAFRGLHVQAGGEARRDRGLLS